MKNILKQLIVCIGLLLAGETYAQQFVTGVVSEMLGTAQEPSIGVNVSIQNAQNRLITGTITNFNGEYSLNIPEEKGDLYMVFSYIGMKTQKIKFTGQKTQNVLLQEDSQTLGEVVITERRLETDELGLTERTKVTANQTIKMDEAMEGLPVTSVEEALQGRLSGVDIIAASDPGAKNSIRIRGTATLNSSADPLIVVNGVPYSTDVDDSFDFATANNEDYADMLNLNPYDIESIEVLKDAASTAVYGTAGANGVLLITTKKGAKGKTRFTFSTKWTTKVEPDAIPMLSGDEYVAFIQDAIWNTANAQGLGNSSTNLNYLFDTPEINYTPDWRYFDEYNQNVDWLSMVKRNAVVSDNSFSMSGGGEKATYRFSLSYLDEGGTTIGTDLKRLTTSLNIGYNFSDKLRVDADFTYSDSEKEDNWTTDVRAEALRKMPNKSPYYIDDVTGDYSSIYFSRQNADEFQGAFSSGSDGSGATNFHPLIMANESYCNVGNKEEKMTFRLKYEILPELVYNGYVSMKFKTVKTRSFLPQEATDVTINSTFANRSKDAYSNNLSLQTENKLMYRKNWNERHHLVATALWRTSQSASSAYGTLIYGASSAGMSDPVIGAAVESISSSSSEVRSLSGIMNVNYTFLNRYIVNGTANLEGKSSLGKNSRWGIFPSAGVAWHIQEEPFIRDVEWIDQLKLRGSIGQSGQAPSGTAPYMGTYTYLGDYNLKSAVTPNSMQLNKLKWESSTEYDGGFDLAFFENRLSMTFDYYYKLTDDLLQKKVAIPTSTGYNDQGNTISYYNSGKISNEGWEYRIEYDLYRSKDWKVSANFNISRNINKIVELPDNMTEVSFTMKNGRYAQKYISGTPVGSFFGFKYEGVYQNLDDTYARDEFGTVMSNLKEEPIVMKNGTYTCYPGDAKYKDVNYDGVIDEKDIVYIGNCNPVVTGGGGFNVKYKDLSLIVFMHYRIGQKVINTARMNSESMYGSDNQSKAVLQRWRNEGDDTDIPRALWQYGYNWLGSDRFVEDCSFLRLKTVSFSYNLPKKICKKIAMNSVNLFLTGYDLFTLTDYTGQDPEVSLPNSVKDLAEDNAQTPRSRRFALGATLNF